jgi:hypothetical protein
MRTPITLSLIMLAASLLTACASDSSKKFSATPDPSAFEWALREDITFHTWMSECSKISPELSKQDQQLRADWLKNYWPALAIADQKFNESSNSQRFSYNKEFITLPAVKLLAEQKQKTFNTIHNTKRSTGNQAEYCQRRFDSYANKEAGIGKKTEINRLMYLLELAKTSKNPLPATQSLPTAAGSLMPSSEPGSSLYSIEKLIQKNDCANPDVLTLRNEWPHEFYGVYCASKTNLFIACEWGKCKTVQP